jgi:PAS domain S-box-containing protein
MITSISSEELSAYHSSSPRFLQVITNQDGHFLSGNEFFKKKFGIQHLESSYSFSKTISSEYTKQYQAAIETCIRQRLTVPVELQHHLPDIEDYLIYWEVSLIPTENDQPKQLQWTGTYVQYINEKKKAADQLKQSELFFRSLIADSLDGMLLVNEVGTISFASASVVHILGFQPEELIGKNSFDFVHADDLELCVSAFKDELNEAPKQKFIGIRLLQKSGEWLWCMVRGHNQFSNPAVGKMLIYFCDDSYRRSIEAALIESRERFFHLIQNLNIGVILCDAEGSIQLCNQTCLELFHVKEEVLIGKSVFNTSNPVIDENGNPLTQDKYPVAEAVNTKSVVKNRIIGVETIERTIWLQVNAQPILEDRNQLKHVICSFIDITEQRNLALQLKQQEQQKQKQLMQATIDGQERERSEISRELHDNISQHLTTTRLYLEVLKDKTDGHVLEMIAEAHKGLMYIINVIRSLSQTLAPPELRDIGLIESIRDLCDLLKKLHPYRVEFEHDQFNEDKIPDNMKLMLFRIIQEQVNNIIRHAEANTITINLQASKTEAELVIADDGKGFDTTLVKKGLGLTNIFNRVNLFDGYTEIVTSPGNGCFLKVIVPLK